MYPSLVSSVLVWGYAIQKIECANHATKCYFCSTLEKLVHDNPSYTRVRASSQMQCESD